MIDIYINKSLFRPYVPKGLYIITQSDISNIVFTSKDKGERKIKGGIHTFK